MAKAREIIDQDPSMEIVMSAASMVILRIDALRKERDLRATAKDAENEDIRLEIVQ